MSQSTLRLSEAVFEGAGDDAASSPVDKKILDVLTKRLNGEIDGDAVSESSDSDISELGDFSTFFSQPKDPSTRRKSCNGRRRSTGPMTNLMENMSKKKMTSIEIVNLLRRYNEQKKDLTEMEESVIASDDIQVPPEYLAMTFDERAQFLLKTLKEIHELEVSFNEQAGKVAQDEIDKTVQILKDHIEGMKAEVNTSSAVTIEIPQEWNDLLGKSSLIKSLMAENESLVAQVKERIEELKILKGLKKMKK